jgi:hypothetical protein
MPRSGRNGRFLHALDGHRLHTHPYPEWFSVLCDFTSDLRNAVLDAMDEMVMAEGRGEIELNGTSVHVLHLARLEALSSTKPTSLESLARAQDVQPLSSLAELGGAPIKDFDEFLEAVKSARSGDE